MSDFLFWLTEGLWHIADLKAYDHILFLAVLFAGVGPKDWRLALALVTGFTLGHSVTLALSVFSIWKAKMSLIEFLIPCTILVTGITNLYFLNKSVQPNRWFRFFLTAGFGLIHGLGFSTLLRSLLGKTQSIAGPLLSFNIGLEVGQLIIIAALALLGQLVLKFGGVNEKSWRFFISSAAMGIAFIMAMERFPW